MVAQDGPDDLTVATTIDGTAYAEYGDTAIGLGGLWWHVDMPEQFWRYHQFLPEQTSCSGGAATSFSGVFQFWTWPEGWFNHRDFELTRTA